MKFEKKLIMIIEFIICIQFSLQENQVIMLGHHTYRIFSIKRPRRLFQTLHGRLSVCLNQQFIWARHFLRKCYYLFFLAAM